ncbi:nucleoside hydrolase [Microlunatus soli]|uniref:nucleoside hydrolase n=1 Tax=Microlunatus soli TaxID=630515 RepID=UPI000B80E038|nr:nucleoside hydrolase [Microlunatus soli]
MSTRLVLDCDTGTDDAVAIMAGVGHPDLDLVAITTVNGNVALQHSTENTLRALEHVGATVPVHPGSPRPLVRPDLPIPRDVLNADNPDFQVAELDLAPSHSRPSESSAVRFLIDFFADRANDDVALVATGPLTNIALAVAAEPGLANRISRLVLMGGAHLGGNVTPVAEFNIWADPEAARMVLSAGIADVVIFGLDATHSVPLTLADCDHLDRIGTPAGTASATMVRHRIRQDQGTYPDADLPSAPVHDPLCLAYLVNPEVITEGGRFPVSVETAGEQTLGQLILDTRPWAPEPPNATVALRASAELYREFLFDGCGARGGN